MLEQRVKAPDEDQGLVSSDAALNLFSESDKKECVSYLEQDEARQQSQRDLKERVLTLQAQFIPDQIRKATESRGKQAQHMFRGIVSMAFEDWVGHRWFDGQTADINEASAREMAPPGSNLYRETSTGGRWLGFLEPHGARSRQWSVYGKCKSLTMVMRWLWLRCLEDKHLTPLDCPIENLFGGKRTGNGPKDSAAATRLAALVIP